MSLSHFLSPHLQDGNYSAFPIFLEAVSLILCMLCMNVVHMVYGHVCIGGCGHQRRVSYVCLYTSSSYEPEVLTVFA